jgi:hypothetical protein
MLNGESIALLVSVIIFSGPSWETVLDEPQMLFQNVHATASWLKSDWSRVDWLGPNLNDFDRVIVCDLAMNTGIRKYWAYILNPALTHE